MPCTGTTLAGTTFIESYDDNQERNKWTVVFSTLRIVFMYTATCLERDFSGCNGRVTDQR